MPLSYRNQSIDLLCKSLDWFLYDRDLHHEKRNKYKLILVLPRNDETTEKMRWEI